MLVGFVHAGRGAGTYRIVGDRSPTPPARRATVGAAGADPGRRAGQVGDLPVQLLAARPRWRRRRPVSAYLHAAAMVKAGVYLVGPARRPAFADAAPWRPLVLRARRGDDAARRLAGAAPARPQAAAGVRHGQPARPADRRCSARAPGRRAGRGRRCCWRTRCSRRRCSWSSASSTTRPAPGTCARLSGRGPRDARRCARSPCWPRRRWPGCRRWSASSPRRRCSRRSAPGIRPAGSSLAAWSPGSALTVAYSARFLWGAFADKPGVDAPRPAQPRRAAAAVRPARRCSSVARAGAGAAGRPVRRVPGAGTPAASRDPGRRHAPGAVARADPGAAAVARWRCVGGRAALRWPREPVGQAAGPAARTVTGRRRRLPDGSCAGSTGWPSRSPAPPSAARCRTIWA